MIGTCEKSFKGACKWAINLSTVDMVLVTKKISAKYLAVGLILDSKLTWRLKMEARIVKTLKAFDYCNKFVGIK